MILLLILVAICASEAGTQDLRPTLEKLANIAERLPKHPGIDSCDIPRQQRYKNLFVHQRSLLRMVNQRVINDAFHIKDVKYRYNFPGVCPKPRPLSTFTTRLKSLPECAAPESLPNRPQSTILHRSQGSRRRFCCKTEFSFTVPQTVQSIFDNETVYKVIHSPPSWQVLQEGSCKSRLGSRCNSHGTCQEESRMQWVLVEIGNQEIFVPVAVPNHCYCQYT